MRSSYTNLTRTFSSYLYILPPVVIILVFIIIPIFYAIDLSFYNVHLIKPRVRFVGLKNYLYILHNSTFWEIFYNSMRWIVFGVLGTILIGLGLGLFLNLEFRFNSLIRGLIFIPWIMPEVCVAFAWRWMLNSEMGVINEILKRLNLISNYVAWLAEPRMVLYVCLFVAIWRIYPFIALMILATLHGIPKELYEAGAIDGANFWQRFWYLTFPQLRYALTIGALLTIIWLMNSFTTVFIMTEGGPLHYSEILPVLIYKTAFQSYRLSRAAAISMINFTLLLIFSLIYLWVFRKQWRGS
ncbi:MAG TPA: sugar ABC transporter permease [Candidatus Aerophobetes bacterium]|uniref:Sugar ABC transporter permease n=1 Tax=Aerophobetes bacterium TaxID=2030807 RepID=A0A7V0QS63_UNCAE|nr:sugar ABC transporter permease [Candidatus Aerophobetes bacterium]